MKKLYAWTINYGNRRGEYVRTCRGILRAENEEEALTLLWDRMGNDFAYLPAIEEIPEDFDLYSIFD